MFPEPVGYVSHVNRRERPHGEHLKSGGPRRRYRGIHANLFSSLQSLLLCLPLLLWFLMGACGGRFLFLSELNEQGLVLWYRDGLKMLRVGDWEDGRARFQTTNNPAASARLSCK